MPNGPERRQTAGGPSAGFEIQHQEYNARGRRAPAQIVGSVSRPRWLTRRREEHRREREGPLAEQRQSRQNSDTKQKVLIGVRVTRRESIALPIDWPIAGRRLSCSE